MKKAAHDRGLDQYIYPSHGNQLTLIDQTGCKYENKVNTPAMPNKKAADEVIAKLRYGNM